MRFYIETYGCQMNECDSKMIESMLAAAGHASADGPESADVVIVNTCAVRERAERRALGRLRHLRGLMRADAALGVVGCVAERLGERLLRDVPGLGFVVGTDSYGALLSVIAAGRSGRRGVMVGLDSDELYEDRPAPTSARVSEFVSVTRGCDNVCAYCVVPHVRGRERSRPISSVLREVAHLVDLGARDITLVGQNVNSYAHGPLGFADLLTRTNDVPGLSRIRFATSHPKDLTDAIIDAVASLEKVCEHVHLPVQSGSDAVLASMNRPYDRRHYVRLVEELRARVEGVAITTDLIVGFPGESEGDFAATLSLMREVRFDSAFMFRYSPRPGTTASALADDVPEAAKIARLESVIDLQRRITEERNLSLVGTTHEVLVEGESEKGGSRSFGRTRTGKPVVFEAGPCEVGQTVPVRITGASAWTLSGSLATRSEHPGRAGGERPCRTRDGLLD